MFKKTSNQMGYVETMWEERSGFLTFLYNTHKEVKRFNNTFGFEITHSVLPPSSIDGNPYMPMNVAFVLIRQNKLIPQVQYCVYALLRKRLLHGFLGIYNHGNIKTLQELEPIKNFKKAEWDLYDWLRELVKTSCKKYL